MAHDGYISLALFIGIPVNPNPVVTTGCPVYWGNVEFMSSCHEVLNYTAEIGLFVCKIFITC